MRRGWWLPGFSERLRGWGLHNGENPEWEWNADGPDAAAGEAVGEARSGAAAEGRAGEASCAGRADGACAVEGAQAGVACSSEPYEGLARRLNDFAPRSSADVPTPEDAGRNLLRASRDFAAMRRIPPVQPQCVSDVSLSDSSEFCRICRDSAGREPLISPCDCRGTVRFVHKSCLERWLAESDTSFCEICGLRYVTERTPRYSLLKSVFLWAMASRRELMMDVMTFLTFMPLAVLGTTMGMTASRSLCYGLLSEPNDDGVSNLVLLVEPQLGPVAAQVCAGTLTAAVVAVMAAMDIAVSTWLVLRVQQHAARCYAWWRRHCVVRLVLAPPEPEPVAVEGNERDREIDRDHDNPQSEERIESRRSSTREAPESGTSAKSRTPSSLAATAAARLAAMAADAVLKSNDTSTDASLDMTCTPRTTESAFSDLACSSDTSWDTTLPTTETTDSSCIKTPSRRHITRGTVTNLPTSNLESIPSENPTYREATPPPTPETSKARGIFDSKSDNVFNGEVSAPSNIVYNMKPSVLPKAASGGACCVKSGKALACKPGTTLLANGNELKACDMASTSRRNASPGRAHSVLLSFNDASQEKHSPDGEEERGAVINATMTPSSRSYHRSHGTTSYKVVQKSKSD